MKVRMGYWILLNKGKTFSLTGAVIEEYNFSAQDRWYMIGGCTLDAKATAVNCSIGVIYHYVQGVGYQRVLESESLEQGKGYWILLNNMIGQAKLSVEAVGQDQ